MIQAKSVHSTQSTNTSAPSPQSSRRGFLAQAAGAAAAGAAIGVSLPLPPGPTALAQDGPGEADPIFAAIEAHQASFAYVIVAIDAQEAVEDELPKERRRRNEEADPRWIASQKAVSAAWEAESGAAIKLINIRPTTPAGIIALLNYAISADRDGETWPEELVADDGETIRSWHYFLIQNLAEILPGLMAA
jgi:hypothetical protein